MRDISLHVLDLAQNSIKAQATLVEMMLVEDHKSILTVTIKDNGHGMPKDMLEAVQSPFVTSRTERKVGLGIPMFAQNARLSGGDIELTSELGVGTTLKGIFHTDQIDCLPIGDLAETFYTLIIMNPLTPDFFIEVSNLKGAMTFDTRQIREALGGLPLNEPEIAAWVHEALYEELTPILEG